MEKLLTAEEAAAACRVPPATLAQWRRKRKGPPWFKPGKWVVYRESAVEAWMKQQEDQQTERREPA